MKKRANVFSIIAFAFAILGLIMQMSMYVAQDFYIELFGGVEPLDDKFFQPVDMIGSLVLFAIYTAVCAMVICTKRNNALVIAVVGMILFFVANIAISFAGNVYAKYILQQYLEDGEANMYAAYSLLTRLRGFFVAPCFSTAMLFHGISLGALVGEKSE